MFCQRLSATNDTNGNPRRVWVVYGDAGFLHGTIMTARDEAYGGQPQEFRTIPRLPDLEITPAEYKHILKHYAHREFMPF
jgi:hypothetical protein